MSDRRPKRLPKDWYPSDEALDVAQALFAADADAVAAEGPIAAARYDTEAMTQKFVRLYVGSDLYDDEGLDEQLLDAVNSDGERTWTAVWLEWMRLEHVRRTTRARLRFTEEAMRAWVDSGEHERTVRPVSRTAKLAPGWRPPPDTYRAAQILAEGLPLEAVHTQFHLQFDGRTLDSMEACDWIRDEDATDWPAVWLIYVRQVMVSRRERLAREAKSQVDVLTAAAVVREQGGLRLLRGAAG